MRFAVVQLRTRGVRLRKEEIAAIPAVIGDLQITDWKGGNAEGRAIRRAALIDRKPQFERDLLVPIFDPYVVRMQPEWFVLRGFEYDAIKDHRTAEYAQEWLVREVTPQIEEEARAALAATTVRHPHQG
jgi:hypothetical protein